MNELEHFEQSSAYDALQKQVLRFAEQWTRQSKVDATLIEQLAKSLPPGHLVTLAATVALANWTNKFNESFGIQLP